jgi:hypothetical protein
VAIGLALVRLEQMQGDGADVGVFALSDDFRAKAFAVDWSADKVERIAAGDM